MSEDLRGKITTAIDPHVETISGTETRDAADAVLAVFADWLEERAEEHRELAQQRPIGSTTLRAQRTATVRRQLLLALASEIDPEEHHAD